MSHTHPRHTILVVEDDSAVLRLVKSILKTGGYEVLTASSAAEGLRIGIEFSREIHLLLADVVMPAMLGTDLAALIREHRPGLRVILMSGQPNGDLGILQRGWQFLEKPFQGQVLLELVRRELMGSKGAAG